MTFAGNQGASLSSGTLQTVGATSTNKLYYDLRNTKSLEVSLGETITTTPNYTGGWMQGHIYVDWNNDGDFEDDGEYVASPKNIVNGVYYTQDYAYPKEFTIPSDAKQGTYTMRYTIDWNSPDGDNGNDQGAQYPCGRTPSTASGNYTADNGGIMVDLELKITKTSGTVYTFTPKIGLPRTALSEIKVNGTAIAGYDPNKYTYVVNVNNPVGEQPMIEYPSLGDVIVEHVIENSKHVQLKVTDTNEPAHPTKTYDVYFYYPSDVIPNGEFTEWTKATYNNANKPTGWGVPADKDDVFSGTAKTGHEVFKENESVVGFKTTYWAALFGPIPAVATIGDISCKMGIGFFTDKTEVNFSGGIPYRNTPDEAIINYYYKKKEGNGALFAFRFFDDTEHNLDYLTTTTTSDYTEYHHALNTKNLAPNTMNIAINATNETVGGSSGAELYVDYIRFAHSSTLTNIVIDGVSNSVTNNYTIDADYQGIPAISAVGEVPDQEHTIQIAETETESGANMLREVTINSKAEDGTSTNYSFNIVRPKSSNNQLKGIKINGVALADFESNKLTYSYAVANGTTRTPDIEAICGSMHQVVKINTDGINTATIVVTPENGSATTYSINFVEEKSDIATLKEITIEGNPADFAFDENISEYNVALASNATLPMISFDKNSDGQTVTMTTGETATLHVVAENGTSENTYTINFIREEIETDAKLKDIAIDNSTLPTFNSDIYEYNVEKNSEILLTYEKNFVADSLITTIYADSVIWQVENKTSEKNRYKLAFSKVVSSNAYLDGILTEKVLISGFEKDLFNYEIVSETIPEISIEKGDKNQSITTTFNEKQIVISVVAENGINGQMYTIDFISPQPKSDNALLGGIEIGGEPLADFVASEFNYNYTLPMHTDILPTISIISGGVGQDITITSNGIEGITNVVVVAEDGVSSETYAVLFSVTPCNNSTLSNIQVDGELLTATSSNFECDKNFDANEQEYTLLFPNDRTTYPEIKAIPAHELCQSLTIDTIRISRTECDIKIKVVAENEVDSTIYLLHIIKKKSSNALLKMIYVDEEEIVGFDESTLGYVVNLPYGSTIIPNTTCEKQEDGQIITITPATTVNDVTTIEVIAENGTDKNTYSISYNILPSDNAKLSGIFVEGELISTAAVGFNCDENFDSENYEYKIFLPVGTTMLPEITWTTTVPDITSATLETNGIESATITIIAQDGIASETYTISFEVLKSDNNKLADLQVEGVTIGTKQNDPYEVYFGNYDAGNIADTFNPDSVVYTLVYPIGTDSSSIIKKEDIDFDRGEDSQTVTISQTKPTEFLITVTAENGIPNYYVINVKILLSNNSLLKDIKIDGLSIETFDPTVFYYEYMLYQGDTIPSILPEKQEDSQIISVITKPVGEETLITCQAEDLSTSQYKILFKYSTENPGDAPTPDDVRWIALGGGRWKATSKRNNVWVYIFEPSGRMIDVGEVPIIGANDNLDSKDANGKIFRFARGGNVYIYCFVHEKKRLMSGKFLY